MTPDLKKFIKKFALLNLPVFILLGLYIILDPFKVVRFHTNYYPKGNNFVTINRSYVSTEMINKLYSKYRYDSFIMGSSRSMFYETAEWKKHLTSDRTFHFDASGESLYGIYVKVKYLEKNKIPAKNILWIIDKELLIKTDDYKNYLYVSHPDLSGQSWIMFHYQFLKPFYTYNFLKAYLKFKATRIFEPFMADYIMNKREIGYDSTTNEYSLKAIEKWIKSDSAGYYTQMKDFFFKRDSIEKTDEPVITSETQKNMLQEIKHFFDSNKTNYRIIISPLYNQLKMNPQDIILLKKYFGNAFVFDFSGKNFITVKTNNYYENSHYRPRVTRMLMDSIYADPKNK